MAGTRAFRTIKKYPNRRLYDTEESRYITLSDIRELVLEKTEFTVIDTRTKDDITRCILLQVICEQEQNGDPILSEAVLSQVIRAYGHPLSSLIADQLEEGLEQFIVRQNNFPRDPGEIGGDEMSPKIP